MAISIHLNGDAHPLAASVDIERLLADLGLDPRMVAVERNRAVVKKTAYSDTLVNDGDEIEIVAFVGGG